MPPPSKRPGFVPLPSHVAQPVVVPRSRARIADDGSLAGAMATGAMVYSGRVMTTSSWFEQRRGRRLGRNGTAARTRMSEVRFGMNNYLEHYYNFR